MKPIILCVDDEPMILMSMKAVLQKTFSARFDCETADDGETALAMIAEFIADETPVILIVSDWLMPGIRGDEMLRQVRTRWPGIAAIMVTGQADPQTVQQVMGQGLAREIISKPWSADALIAAVERACEPSSV